MSLFLTLALPIYGELWTLAPGVTQRGQAPETWTLDLRQATSTSAIQAALRLSSRLYGPANPALNQPLILHMDFAAPKLFAFELSAIARGGADLLIKTNDVVYYRHIWPATNAPHRPQRILHLPIAPGPLTLSLEVTQPGGVVLIDRYYLADGVTELPSVASSLLLASAADLSGASENSGSFTGDVSRPADGYRGIWFTLGQFSEQGDKYSGGLGTYTANHIPLAVYAPQVNKTFFVYGGTIKDRRHLLVMASYYDHAKHVVPRPTIVHDKQGVNDPHDNPSIAIDDRGHIWVFISGRGRGRPGFKYRSRRPYDVSEFGFIEQAEFTYPQPWFVVGKGFLHLFTKYTAGRELYWETSRDGLHWSEPQKLAGLEGHYQVSAEYHGKLGSFFNRHPGGSVDRRTDLYYVQTTDWGKTWTTVDGWRLALPLSQPDNPARVIEYSAHGRLMYTMDLRFDRHGHPVLLYLTARGHQPGPKNDPREWTITKWTGQTWETHLVCRSDHNYDCGSLFLGDQEWSIIGPTEVGPQPYGTGGEVALWASQDEGRTWTKKRQITHNSAFNHAYVRRPLNARDPFYVFWADGNPEKPSVSRLYFANQEGSQVWRLPYDMSGEFAKPELLLTP